MKRISAILCALLLLTAVMLPVMAFAIEKGDVMYVATVKKHRLNMRSAPEVGNNIVGEIAHGTRVTVVDPLPDNPDWVLVLPDGWSNPYYCMSSLLSKSKTGPDKQKKETTESYNYASFKHVSEYKTQVAPSRAGGFVNLRWAPSKSSPSMMKLYGGTSVTVLAKGKGWWQVRVDSNGYTGFIMDAFVN